MISKEKIQKKMDELYPSRNSNIFKEGRSEAVAIVETLMAQGFMDCLKFISEQVESNNKLNLNKNGK